MTGGGDVIGALEFLLIISTSMKWGTKSSTEI